MLNGHIIASDYPSPNIINSLERNIKANLPVNSNNWKVIGHEWGGMPLRDYEMLYDYIFMADTLWIQAQHENLISDLKCLLKPSGKIYGCAGLHTGLKVLLSFFEMAKSNGLDVLVMDYYTVPVGSGPCENVEWVQVDEISDRVEDRKWFMVFYVLLHSETQ